MKSKLATLFGSKKNKANHRDDLEIKLIQGSFSSSEAADILLSFLNDKIKFHTIKQLNLNAGDDSEPSNSEERILYLREAKKKVTAMLVDAHKVGEHLQITSTINIKFLNGNES